MQLHIHEYTNTSYNKDTVNAYTGSREGWLLINIVKNINMAIN